MMNVRVTSWHLRDADQPHLIKSYDMRNAFGTGRLSDLDETLTKRAITSGLEAERDTTCRLLSQRRFNAQVCIPTEQGPLTMKLGGGGIMGDVNEPEAFMDNFYDT